MLIQSSQKNYHRIGFLGFPLQNYTRPPSANHLLENPKWLTTNLVAILHRDNHFLSKTDLLALFSLTKSQVRNHYLVTKKITTTRIN